MMRSFATLSASVTESAITVQTLTTPIQRLEALPRLGHVSDFVAPPEGQTFLRRNRTVVWFVVLLVVADLVLGQFANTWQRHSPDDYALRVQGCAREPRDLVVLGGSPVTEGIDPDRLRGTGSIYAMGFSGGTTSDFYHGVLLGCPTPPRVLVYGITATDVNDSRHEPHGPYSLMTAGDVARWVKRRPEAGEWVVRHYVQSRVGQASNLFRYRHGIRLWAATEADAMFPGRSPETMREADELREHADQLLTGNGYAPARGFTEMHYDAVKAAGLASPHLPYLAKFRTGSHLKYLHALIDWCEANGVKFVLVDMPVTQDLETIHAAEFAEYRSRLAEVERDRGLSVIRATRGAIGLNDWHFADLIHLNRHGARVFSDWLAGPLAAFR
jgi:hypothetical protein